MDHEKKYLRSEQAAAHLDIPLETLRYWRKNGTGPKGVKIGRHVMYRRADLDAWMEHQFVKAGA